MSRLRILGGPGFYPGKIQITRPPLPELNNIAERLAISLSTGILTKGEQLSEFEAEVSACLGVKYAIGMSSCTIGLALSMAALKWKLGVKLDDKRKILVPSFTFLATATSSCFAGLEPVFVDADESTFNISAKDLERKATSEVIAIVCTYVFGNPTGVQEILDVANKHNLPVVFDAAHGFGITHRGKGVGGDGIASSFSLTPTKLLTSGEGGFVTTNDEEMTYNLRILREYGTAPGMHDTVYPGLNGRMSEIHAILGRWGLGRLETEAEGRTHRVKLYKEKLKGVNGLAYQRVDASDRCSYKDFAVKVDSEKFGLSRDQLAKVLTAENFECKKYFYPAVHNHTYFKRDGQDLCPAATKLSQEMLCPPLYGNMTDAQQDAVASAIIEAHENADKIRKVLG